MSGGTAPSILNLGTEYPWVIASRPDRFTLLDFATEWTTEGGIMLWLLAATREFSLLQKRQIGSGSHPASYSTGTCGPFPVVKAAGSWSWPFVSIYGWG